MPTDNTRAEAIEAVRVAADNRRFCEHEIEWDKAHPGEIGPVCEPCTAADVPHLLAPIRELAEELVNHGRNAQQTTDGHMLRKMLDAIEEGSR